MTGPEQVAGRTALMDAATAGRDAGVQIRMITELTDHSAAVALVSDIWGRAENPPVTTELLRVLSKAEHYISAAFAGNRMIGVTIAFHGSPDRHILHSHIAGVDPDAAGQGVGYAMKLHQRAWAVQRGIEVIEWTFDPLVARNAHFNICKLAATPEEYLVNFYGTLADSRNGTDESDRLLVRWRLGTDQVLPTTDTSVLSTVAVPDDIEYLRRHDPESAHAWRSAVRESLGELMRVGGRVVGFERGRGYIVQSPKEIT